MAHGSEADTKDFYAARKTTVDCAYDVTAYPSFSPDQSFHNSANETHYGLKTAVL